MSECLPDLPRYVRQRNDEWQGADHQNGPWRAIPAPQSGLPWPAPPTVQTTPLSPAAQAVWDAWNDACEAQGPLEDMGQPLGAAQPPAAQPAPPAAPAGELVERVAYVIGDDPLLLSLWEDDARAAIREEADA